MEAGKAAPAACLGLSLAAWIFMELLSSAGPLHGGFHISHISLVGGTTAETTDLLSYEMTSTRYVTVKHQNMVSPSRSSRQIEAFSRT
jgi:hypothetical protein